MFDGFELSLKGNVSEDGFARLRERLIKMCGIEGELQEKICKFSYPEAKNTNKTGKGSGHLDVSYLERGTYLCYSMTLTSSRTTKSFIQRKIVSSIAEGNILDLLKDMGMNNNENEEKTGFQYKYSENIFILLYKEADGWTLEAVCRIDKNEDINKGEKELTLFSGYLDDLVIL